MYPSIADRLPANPRYQSLDFWRGVACLSVIGFHGNMYLIASKPPAPWLYISLFLDQLWLGVPIFFVISGYCISATADAERRRRKGLLSYFQRRFRRIFPPFWIALAGFVVLILALDQLVPALYADDAHTTVAGLHWLGNGLLIETWFGRILDHPRLFLGHTWTLCYEEQFYALTGCLLWLCPRRFFSGAVGVTAITLAVGPLRPRLAGVFLDGNWLMFAVGIAVYYGVNYSGVRRAALLISGVIGGFLAFTFVGWKVVSYTTLLAATFGVVLLGLHRFDARMAENRWMAPITWCGQMCYSLYLVHWPICKGISHAMVLTGFGMPTTVLFLGLPLCYAASIAAGWGFHILVERRFMNPPRAAIKTSTRQEQLGRLAVTRSQN